MDHRALLLTAIALVPGCASAPPDLDGVWVKPGAAVPYRLELDGRRWTLDSGDLRKSGVFDLTERRMAFVLEETSSVAFEVYCREAVDVYRWRFENDRLSLRAVERTCDRAAHAVLTAGEWVRRGAGG